MDPLASESLNTGLISTIIRFHDPTKTEELSIALLSVAGQSYDRVEPIIALQDFSDDEEEQVRQVAASIPWRESFEHPVLINVQNLGPGDHRAALANAGISVRKGSYLAFLDYDDVIYGKCYELLTSRLRTTNKAVAFGGVVASDVEKTGYGAYALAKRRIFKGVNKDDFFINNHYPIHSFVLNTTLIDDSLLGFDTGHSRNEDYAFLLRILSRHDWDIGEFDTPVAEYSMRVDGSNTIMSHSDGDDEKWRQWLDGIRYVDSLKRDLEITLAGDALIEILQRSHEQPRHAGLEAFLPALMSYIGAAATETTEHGNLDLLSADENGILSAAGWIASPLREPLSAVLIAETTADGPELLALGVPSIDRQDVRTHLGVESGVFGFQVGGIRKVDHAPANPAVYALDGSGRVVLLLNPGDEDTPASATKDIPLPLRRRIRRLLGRAMKRFMPKRP